MTNPEIPEEALAAMWEAFWGPDAAVVMDGKGARQMRRLLAAALPHLRVQETRAYEWSAAIRRRGKVDRFGVTFCDDESEYAKRFALDEMYDGERSGQEGEEFVLMRRSIGEWEVTGRE